MFQPFYILVFVVISITENIDVANKLHTCYLIIIIKYLNNSKCHVSSYMVKRKKKKKRHISTKKVFLLFLPTTKIPFYFVFSHHNFQPLFMYMVLAKKKKKKPLFMYRNTKFERNDHSIFLLYF